MPGSDKSAAPCATAADLGRQFGQLQARFNSIRIPATFPDFDAKAAGLLREWDPALATAFVAAKGDSGLLHLDYHLLNVLADGGQITGVIDWVNAGRGDVRLDFARTIALLDFLTMWDSTGNFDPFMVAYEETWLAEMGAMQDRSLFLAIGYAFTAENLKGRAMPEETAALSGKADAFMRAWAT